MPYEAVAADVSRRHLQQESTRRLTGVLPNLLNWEGERPREPKHLWNPEEIRARADARPPIKGLGQHALTSAATLEQ